MKFLERIKDIPVLFILLLFFLAVVMIVWGCLWDDYLFYIRAGIFAVAGLLLGWLKGIRVRLIFAWYDFWVGFFWDRKKRRLYFLPVPMFGLKIQLEK